MHVGDPAQDAPCLFTGGNAWIDEQDLFRCRRGWNPPRQRTGVVRLDVRRRHLHRRQAHCAPTFSCDHRQVMVAPMSRAHCHSVPLAGRKCSLSAYRERWLREKYRGAKKSCAFARVGAGLTCRAVRYATRRLGHAALVLMGVSFLTFALAAAAPGTFVDELRLDPRVSPETVAAMRDRYGLNETVPEQYVRWLQSIVRGEFGFSI